MMPPPTPGRVLILGGTRLAYDLAAHLASEATPDRWHVLTSLAGRTSHPRHPPGEIRIGGFGGVDGMTESLRQDNIMAVIDATHRFAWQISHHAERACRALSTPYLRLEPRRWRAERGWLRVRNEAQAARVLRCLLPGLKRRRVLLALGYQHLRPFRGLPRGHFLVRTLNPAAPIPLMHARRLIQPPGDYAQEYGLLRRARIDALVARNSGGTMGYGKLRAAQKLGIRVILIDPPTAIRGPKRAQTPRQARAWLAALRGF
ncbi:MAG: precorrin-6A/cobalt-precorrin-6A reductase [Pseudomonadota bacterium]